MNKATPTGHPGDEGVGAGHEADQIPLLAPHFEPPVFPWRQIVGYGISLLLTAAAILAVIHHALAPTGLIVVVLCMAVLQAAVQLGYFMHVRESVGPAWHLVTLALGIGVGIGIVAFSVWIVAFKSGAL